MALRILCFEDNPDDRKILEKIFAKYKPEFKFFVSPASAWSITPAIACEISEFAPSFAIVDLMDDYSEDSSTPGYRVIRQLKETEQSRLLPVIAWSRLFRDTPDGRRAVKHAEALGAVPLQKPTEILPEAESFLDAVRCR